MNLSRAAFPLVLVLVSAYFAGCVGSDDEEGPKGKDNSVPSLAPPAEYNDETGAIKGFILDTEFVPLPGAQVGIQDTDHTTIAAEDGSFTFSLLPPAEYVLLATQLGYEQAVMRVNVEVGKVTEGIELKLEKIPVVVPYTFVDQFVGFITCSIGFANVISEECGQGLQHPAPPPVPNPIGRNARNNIDWMYNITTIQDLQTIYYELDWQPASAAANKLGFHVAHGFTCIPACDEDIAYCPVFENYGPPVQYCKIPVEALGIQDAAEDLPWDITARAWAARVEATDVPNIVLEQAFTMYRTDFYGAEMQDGYSAVPPR